MGQLTATRFRVTNYRNIDDSDWIPLEQVAAFVGRNESGKSALLKAVHKFNPATPEPFSPQHEFPRDRYTREFKDAKDWPVCSVLFQIGSELRASLAALAGDGTGPATVTYTRYYDGHFDVRFDPPPQDDLPKGDEVITALQTFRAGVMRLAAPTPEQEDEVNKIRTDLLAWADNWKAKFASFPNVRVEPAATQLKTLRNESNSQANPHTAALITQLQGGLDVLLKRAQAAPLQNRLDELTKKHLPVFIYFDRYGVLDSAIYLPRFVEDLKAHPTSD